MRFESYSEMAYCLEVMFKTQLKVFDGLSCGSTCLPRKMRTKEGHSYCTHCRFSALTGNNRSLEFSLIVSVS